MTAQIAIAREEQYSKPGGKPRVTAPVPIWADLKRRDFTVDAIALGLNRGSRGQLRDPNNGIADLENKELRASYTGVFFDDPSRMLRMIRLKHRLGYRIEERTGRQFENARLEELHNLIPPETRLEELKLIAQEPLAGEILKDYKAAGLMPLFSSALADDKLDVHALEKLERLRKLIPQDLFGHSGGWMAFMDVLTAELNPKEKAELARNIALDRHSGEAIKKLSADAKKLESHLKSARMQKPSHVYFALEAASGRPDSSSSLHVAAAHRAGPHSQLSAEVSPRGPGSIRRHGARQSPHRSHHQKLNARPKKPPVETVEVPPEPPLQKGWTARRT